MALQPQTLAADDYPPIGADRELLLVDGAGGYLLGCADDVPRRRYHALWIAQTDAGRIHVVSGLHERVTVKDGAPEHAVSLLAAHWRGHAEPSLPAGSAHTVQARPLVRRCEGRLPNGAPFCLERSVVLQRASIGRAPALLVQWHNRSGAALRLLARPLLGMCPADYLPTLREPLDATLRAQGASWGFVPVAHLPSVWFTLDGVAACKPSGEIYRGFFYAVDRARGYDHVGDRFSPCEFDVLLPAFGTATLAVSLQAPLADPGAAYVGALAELPPLAERGASLAARLRVTADDFFYTAANQRLGVLAGFPWFGEWGRDVFLALPGLTLARGDLPRCLQVLRGALPFLRRGLLPNIYAATPQASHYGSADAALWFALAVMRYGDAGGDPDCMAQELVPALRSIAEAYFAGSELGLCVDEVGLLNAGGQGLNATWMDAQTAAGPVTPRDGQPVEIEALWCELLAFLAERFPAEFAERHALASKTFRKRFWCKDGKYLADRWHGEPDLTVRPNMVLAAALPRSPLSRVQREAVVQRATAELLTPRGLRTLSPHAAGYRARYSGGCEARDAAYHQGTVWPWLSGFFVEASLRSATPRQLAQKKQELREWLNGFHDELDRCGLAHVSEVFDGDAPHHPGGTMAQAWNSGELLRACQLLAGGVV